MITSSEFREKTPLEPDEGELVDETTPTQSFFTVYSRAIVGNHLELFPSTWGFNSFCGGFYIGPLSKSQGLGAATWQCIWPDHDNSSHADSHRYAISLYRWNGHELLLKKSYRTKNKYDSGEEALKADHIIVRNMTEDFKEALDYF